MAVSPPDGTTVLALVTPKRDVAAYKLIGRTTNVVFVTEDVTAKYCGVVEARGGVFCIRRDCGGSSIGATREREARGEQWLAHDALDARRTREYLGRRIHAISRRRWEFVFAGEF